VLSAHGAVGEAAADAPPNPLGHRVGPQPIRLGQDHGEFLAPVAARCVRVPHGAAQFLAHTLQHQVSEEVAVLVVQQLERIQIQH
jgi:hypothetical protein